MEEVVTDLEIIALICVFSCIHLYCCSGIYLQCSQAATKAAISKIVKPLADYSGQVVEERIM